MKNFIQELEDEVDLLHKIRSRAAQIVSPDFADLLWDQVDYNSLFRDPGIRFETPSRMVALARINGELRYYAGNKNIYDYKYDYELGVFPTVKQALGFALVYLIDEMELRDIEISRNIRWSRFAAKPGSSILRSQFDRPEQT